MPTVSNQIIEFQNKIMCKLIIVTQERIQDVLIQIAIVGNLDAFHRNICIHFCYKYIISAILLDDLMVFAYLTILLFPLPNIYYKKPYLLQTK